MENLYIESSSNKPMVFFNAETGHLELSGKSIPEDALSFYTPLIEWIKKYTVKPCKKTVFSVKLEYFNTSTSKKLLDIFFVLKKIKKAGHDVDIIWYYSKDDEDIQETGKNYSDIIQIPFKFIAV